MFPGTTDREARAELWPIMTQRFEWGSLRRGDHPLVHDSRAGSDAAGPSVRVHSDGTPQLMGVGVRAESPALPGPVPEFDQRNRRGSPPSARYAVDCVMGFGQ